MQGDDLPSNRTDRQRDRQTDVRAFGRTDGRASVHKDWRTDRQTVLNMVFLKMTVNTVFLKSGRCS